MAQAAIKNLGHLINFITGIQGVTAGGNAIINLPVNLRYHSLQFNCTGIYFTGGTAKAITKITGSGTGAAGTLTLNSQHVPTAIAITSGGSGWNVGDTFTIADDTGSGLVGTVATVTGGPPGALATATIAVSAVALNPTLVLSSVKILVNGINIRDIDPAYIIGIQKANGYTPATGELSIFFTEPWRKIVMPNEITSWDMFGQSTFTVQLGIANIGTPGVTGVQEFDYERNTKPTGPNGAPQPFLQPVAQHQFSLTTVSGRNDINTLPFSYPIARVWMKSANADITQVEVYQDSNKILEATTSQIANNLGNAGNGGSFGIVPATGSFDTAYVSDPDQRIWKALKCGNSFVMRVYTSSAEAVTFVMETLPGAYQA